MRTRCSRSNDGTTETAQRQREEESCQAQTDDVAPRPRKRGRRVRPEQGVAAVRWAGLQPGPAQLTGWSSKCRGTSSRRTSPDPARAGSSRNRTGCSRGCRGARARRHAGPPRADDLPPRRRDVLPHLRGGVGGGCRRGPGDWLGTDCSGGGVSGSDFRVNSTVKTVTVLPPHLVGVLPGSSTERGQNGHRAALSDGGRAGLRAAEAVSGLPVALGSMD
jgi:hypothetical protein